MGTRQIDQAASRGVPLEIDEHAAAVVPNTSAWKAVSPDDFDRDERSERCSQQRLGHRGRPDSTTDEFASTLEQEDQGQQGGPRAGALKDKGERTPFGGFPPATGQPQR